MKVFCSGAFFGLIFCSIAIWFLKLSPWAMMPDLRPSVFILGGGLMGGLIHQLIGSDPNVSTE
ncbi:MAG: hypothetical protein K8R69_04760 [Deltaproteobacteria bacterium]|nr:hypothetical protein [Deltaproteobacteria bacterium]